jgi:uncharacterized phage protein gp47/JayE
MPNTSDISSNIIATLALTEPTLDTSIGSITRKIIDAVSGALAEQSADNHLINYTYDIDSKSGADLTDFVALFGLTRIQAGRATGVVTFSRSAESATMVANITLGTTQVNSSGDPPMTFATMMGANIGIGQTSVDVPVQASTPGPSSNVAAGTLVNLATGVPGVERVTNAQPCVGGTNEETDAALRARFKATVFRNLAGTEHMYRAMAMQTPIDPANPNSLPCTAVNVIGPKMTYQEQIAIQSDGTAQSSILDAAFIYPASVYVGSNISIGSTEPQGPNQSYSVTIDNTSSPATLVITSTGGSSPIIAGTIWDLQFDYVSKYSRNDPLGTRWAGGGYISSRVDLWCNGIVSRDFTQSCTFSTNPSLVFTTGTPKAEMDISRFAILGGTDPAVGDYFMPLLAGPVLAVPNTLVDAAARIFTEGIHYDIVHQDDAFGYAPTSKFGLVWHIKNPQNPAESNALPTAGTTFTIGYTYNVVPTRIQQAIESQWRLLGTDAQVHAGVARYYRFHLAVVYLPGYSADSVNVDINTAIMNLINGLGFRSGMQVSDVLQVVHNVAGVDNVRFLTSADDPTNYAIQEIFPDPLYPSSGHSTPAIVGPINWISQIGGRAADVYFNDSSYPMFDPTFNQVRIITKARNTFGVS